MLPSWWFKKVLTSLCLWPAFVQSADISCYQCFDVASPGDCRQKATCGEGEICYTREFRDHRRKQGFHLGCEDVTTCNLLVSAHNLIGKRDNEGSGTCYGCCHDNDCNARLCQDAVGGNGSTSGSLPSTSPATQQHRCPSTFKQNGDSCYHFLGPVLLFTWFEAKRECGQRGAHLVDITSQEEQDFLAMEIHLTHFSSTPWKFWTGGHVNTTTGEWVWSDNTKVSFTAWGRNQPDSNTDNDKIVMDLRYKDWLWSDEGGFTTYKVFAICEKKAE